MALVLVVGLLALERWGPSDGPSFATPGSVSPTGSDPDDPASGSASDLESDLDEPASDPDELASDPDELASDPDELASDPDEPASDPDEPASDPDETESESASDPESGPTGGDECSVNAIAADIGDDERDMVIGVPRCRDGFAVAIAGSLDRVGEGPIVVAYQLTPEGWSELDRVPLSECATLSEVEPTFPIELC